MQTHLNIFLMPISVFQGRIWDCLLYKWLFRNRYPFSVTFWHLKNAEQHVGHFLTHPNVRLQGLLRGKTWQSHVFPLNNPFGPSSLMPQSEMNSPAHLRERRIKENLNYTVLNHTFLHFKKLKMLK